MYISLFIVVMIIGLVMLFLPTSITLKTTQHKWFCVFRRLAGVILILASVVSIYALISGATGLPLFK